MQIRMTLLSDTIFGNGISVPGAEDISVLCDERGFPYMKGGTLKGIFREELNNLLLWKGEDSSQIKQTLHSLLGYLGDDSLLGERKLRFSDLTLSDNVRNIILNEMKDNTDQIVELFSFLRTFTAIDKNGQVEEGSLRSARCLKSGLIFFGTIECCSEDEELVSEVLSLIKWVGTMRNRGFGQVNLKVIKEGSL